MTDPSGRAQCSIVIRAFNEQRHIRRLLEGIAQQSIQDLEIILVDSGSTDATRAIASQYPVKIISIDPSEFTFGYSLNVGCESATGEFLVFASAHVYPVYPDWLEKLLLPFEDEKVGLVYGRQKGDKRTRFSEGQQFAKMFPDQSVARQSHPFCNNANAAIRRRLWMERRYSEDLSGLEDIEWAEWALSQGHLLSYASAAEVIHVHEESPRQVFRRYQREAIALKRMHPEEKLGLWKMAKFFLSNVASDYTHAIRQRKLGAAILSIIWFRWMQFWGTYRGFAETRPVTKRLIQTFYYPRSFRGQEGPGSRDVTPIEYGAGTGKLEGEADE
jgi:glycosyltransferase involved in cell wall biosynthesis